MKCFITRTGSFLPGPPIDNENIQRYIGTLEGEEKVKRQVLAMNGIRQRHYALNKDQTTTYDVYQMAARAIENCLGDRALGQPIDYLSAGSTYAPLSGPGISSILHSALSKKGIIRQPIEVNSNAGICTSSATALINAYRAIRAGDHAAAICVGTEHSTEVLKSTSIQPEHDTEIMKENLKQSKWFMSVFLRFMLSDGAGAFLLRNEPESSGISFEVNWAFAQSFANEAPLCMKLENRNRLLSQDVTILSKYLVDCSRKFVGAAFGKHGETFDDYCMVLPHMSSYFFQRKMERVMRQYTCNKDAPTQYWTNLATAGNTGAASIFIMLDEYTRTHECSAGDRILLFIPESGQFNFVMFSLTVAC